MGLLATPELVLLTSLGVVGGKRYPMSYKLLMAILFCVNLVRVLIASRRREKGLCERCGKNRATTSRSDILRRIGVCPSCDRALSFTRLRRNTPEHTKRESEVALGTLPPSNPKD